MGVRNMPKVSQKLVSPVSRLKRNTRWPSPACPEPLNPPCPLSYAHPAPSIPGEWIKQRPLQPTHFLSPQPTSLCPWLFVLRPEPHPWVSVPL